MSRVLAAALCMLCLPLSQRCFAQDVGVAAEICNEAGVCAPMDPATALLVIGLAQIAKELSKDEPFGKNNDLVKAINTILNDIKNGAGPNNDLLKLFKNAGNDLRCGPGPNNDIIRFLNGLGMKITVTGCQ